MNSIQNGDWGRQAIAWWDADVVGAKLTEGADPNAVVASAEVRPLHQAASGHGGMASAQAVKMLITHGADVEAVNGMGETPLWRAVRWGHREVAQALLAAGADPWRPVLGGRSAGRVALDGPLAELFASLPDAPQIPVRERERQALADELIDSYDAWPDHGVHMTVAFIRGPKVDEVIRALGADPAGCPAQAIGDADGPWVGTPPGGGVVVFGEGFTADEGFMAAVSSGGVAADTSDSPKAARRVNCWRDGVRVATPGDFYDPGGQDPPEAWLCRFGDHAWEVRGMSRHLALMTMFTGVRVDYEWLFHAPEHLLAGPSDPSDSLVAVSSDRPGEAHGPDRGRSVGELSTAIRAWAKAQGIQLNEQGRISPGVIEQYEQAHRNG
jgi:Ankyrin repeats (3 copies)/Lsr2